MKHYQNLKRATDRFYLENKIRYHISSAISHSIPCEKVQEGNDQEITKSERNSHSTNRGAGKKTKMTVRCLYQENIS